MPTYVWRSGVAHYSACWYPACCTAQIGKDSMPSAKWSPSTFSFERLDLDAKITSSFTALRCPNQPSSRSAMGSHIMFDVAPAQTAKRSKSSRARKPSTPFTYEAPGRATPASQGELSAKSQFDLMVSQRSAHHDQVQASLQAVERKPNVKTNQVRD